MKKIALISLCCVALFTACGDDSSSANSNANDEQSSSSVESSSSKVKKKSSSSGISSSEAADAKESSSSAKEEVSSSSAADEPSSSETEAKSSDAESSSSAEPESSAESSSSEESSSSFVSRDIKVGAYQYKFSGIDVLNLSIYNNEEETFSNLSLRLFLTGKPEDLDPAPGKDAPGTCPLIVDEDICQMFDNAGMSSTCLLPDGSSADDYLRYNLRHTYPIKINSSYNASTEEYTYYINIPLGDIELPPASRLHLDISLTSGIYQNGMCETLRVETKKELSSTSGDWSWMAHQKDVDGADYEGIPLWEKDQGDTEKAPINPYIAVYKDDELISGIPPKY